MGRDYTPIAGFMCPGIYALRWGRCALPASEDLPFTNLLRVAGWWPAVAMWWASV